MELPAVRPPRLSWHRRLLQQLAPPLPSTANKTVNLHHRKRPSLFKPMTSANGCPLASRGTSVASTSSLDSTASKHIVCSRASATPRSSSHSLLQHLHRRTDKPQSRKLVLPHTITERHGGKDLWVKAPVISDELEKQGFRWRKKWKPRFVELNGRVLSYYEQQQQTETTEPRKLRKSVHLTAHAQLVDLAADGLAFALTPNPGEKPWVFRARDAKTKRRWCQALHDCIDILIWLQHYEMGDVLGVGGNGVVRELTDTRDGRKFAVKIVDASKFKHRAAAVAEVEILRNITNDIKHDNLVRIHKVYEEQEKIYMILDLCHGGELYDAIVRRGCYGERDAAAIMAQLVSAVDALHRHNILHLDLKPENILLSSADERDARIVLTDFGLARMVHGKEHPLETGKTMAGTIGYIAPEVIASHQYSEAADVFSAGVILFILLVGYPPFHGDSEVEILLKIARGDFQFHAQDWDHISHDAKELVARMLEVRAQDRITIPEILAHPWMLAHSPTAAARKLPQTVERMQQFNAFRKTENMACCMATMLAHESEDDFHALANVTVIDTLIRQLTPSGTNRMTLDKALVFARHLGLSPYIDMKSFVSFLDRNLDGFIDARDFCEGVQAIREGHESFSTIIFDALLTMVRENDTAAASETPKTTLLLTDFAAAFEKLQCPEPLSSYFFKNWTEHHEELGDAIDRAAFVGLFRDFRFLAMLFVQKAKTAMVRIARSGSHEDLAQIAGEIRHSLSLE